jgi:hypothetical protein
VSNGDPAPQQILNLALEDNDARAATIRDYLKKLLSELWTEEEGFSGKRPFGNSDWQNEIYLALANEGWIHAKFDRDGYLEDIDEVTGNRLILSAIEAL